MIRAALVAVVAILFTAAPACAAPFPKHATQAILDDCVKSKDIPTCRNAVDDYYGTYKAAVARNDADEACKDMMYGGGLYLELVALDIDKKVSPDADAQEAAGLFGFIDQNCDSPYSDEVDQIATIAKNWKEGDVPLEVQAINIIEGKPISLTQS